MIPMDMYWNWLLDSKLGLLWRVLMLNKAFKQMGFAVV